ncbi:MAG: hypothetical protein HY075_04475 [Deltaproteobacteria bacterium]|nr:hypothetical protein [Deltaproteobacteria bacterium]
MAQDNRILIVGNPVSGNGRGARLLEAARRNEGAVRSLAAAAAAGDPANWPIVQTTRGGEWKTEVEAFVKTRGIRTVMAIGGDGTLMEVAAHLYGMRADADGLSLVPVPGGRGNDFARAYYGYRLEDGEFWEWAADAAGGATRRWSRQTLDLGSANGRVFINMASIGYGGKVVENAQQRQAFWSKTSAVYQVEGLLAFAGGGRGRVDVKVDGESVYTGPFFGAFVGNGKANGSGLYWTRAARFDDGKLDAIVFPKPGLLEMARSMNAIKSTATPPPDIVMRHKAIQGAEIVFYFDEPVALELDGDFVGDAMQHGFKCLAQALNTWVLKK